MKVNAYKLTDQAMQTYGGWQWTLNETRRTDGEGGLCGPGWLHYYNDPRLAILLNPIHAGYQAPRLFEAHAGTVQLHDPGLKSGTTELTLLREIPLPVFTTTQVVAFAKACADFAERAIIKPRMTHKEILAELIKCAELAEAAK